MKAFTYTLLLLAVISMSSCMAHSERVMKIRRMVSTTLNCPQSMLKIVRISENLYDVYGCDKMKRVDTSACGDHDSSDCKYTYAGYLHERGKMTFMWSFEIVEPNGAKRIVLRSITFRQGYNPILPPLDGSSSR